MILVILYMLYESLWRCIIALSCIVKCHRLRMAPNDTSLPPKVAKLRRRSSFRKRQSTKHPWWPETWDLQGMVELLHFWHFLMKIGMWQVWISVTAVTAVTLYVVLHNDNVETFWNLKHRLIASWVERCLGHNPCSSRTSTNMYHPQLTRIATTSFRPVEFLVAFRWLPSQCYSSSDLLKSVYCLCTRSSKPESKKKCVPSVKLG